MLLDCKLDNILYLWYCLEKWGIKTWTFQKNKFSIHLFRNNIPEIESVDPLDHAYDRDKKADADNVGQISGSCIIEGIHHWKENSVFIIMGVTK